MKQMNWKWADLGKAMLEGPSQGAWASCMAASRLGSIELAAQEWSIWVQVRGQAWVEAKEGRFFLRRGDWIALSRDSHPTLQANRGGLCVGVSVTDDTMKAMAQFSEFGLHAGRGSLAQRDVRTYTRLWHRLAAHLGKGTTASRMEAPLRCLLLHLESMQSEYRSRLQRCPGPSLGRKRQVFDRMQRARLYLEGNCDRMVRVGELAERTQFSVWYFSKVFHRLYDESPQSASAAMRLEHAANLLVSTPMTIGEVGVASGFDNNCSFARSFRARFGMTATDYRGGKHFRHGTQTCGTARANHIAAPGDSVSYARKNADSSSRPNVTGRLTRP